MNRLNRLSDVLTDRSIDLIETVGDVVCIVHSYAAGLKYSAQEFEKTRKLMAEVSYDTKVMNITTQAAKAARAAQLELEAFEASVAAGK